MMDSNEIDDCLCNLYRGVWPVFEEVCYRGIRRSNPLLMSSTNAYVRAPKRLLVVGQQNDGWYDDEDPRASGDAVVRLMTIYRDFDLARPHPSRYRSPFWYGSRLFHGALNGDMDAFDFMWTDLLKVSANRSRVDSVSEAQLAALNLLPKEIEAVKPDVVVFFTGPRYEDLLRRSFPGLHVEALSHSIPTTKVARLRHEVLPGATIRTYHPGYLQRQAGGYDLLRTVSIAVAQMSEVTH